MLKWSEKRRFHVENMSIHFEGRKYEGSGAMDWDPESGFDIIGQLKMIGPALAKQRTYGQTVTGVEDTRTIRMRLGSGQRALVPGLRMRGNLSVIEQGSLRVRAKRVIFTQPNVIRVGGGSGSAHLVTDRMVLLPGRVDRSTRMGSEVLESSGSMGGLVHRDQDVFFRIWHPKDTLIKVSWLLDSRYWSAREAWRWVDAVALAMSILSGWTVNVVEREYWHNASIVTEWQAKPDLTDLDFLSPLPPSYPIAVDRALRLIDFLASKSVQSEVCRQIFWQLVESGRQTTQQGAELMCSTILEASLRTLDGCPFGGPETTWSVAGSLKRFRTKYLGRPWKSSVQGILGAYRELRHRSAHPDWLISKGGSRTRGANRQKVNNMALLSRFYGAMILALSGEQAVTPDAVGLGDGGEIFN